ncbi:MAG: hypothetical protein HOK52_09605 [Candidatus Marinimicrobia bacterium]|nr:hypothetical protein [Candidatus Neomarinimicrobiota bacterium]
METTTLNQIIESAGIAFIAYFSIKTYSKAIKRKKDVKREIDLLKDIIFFQNIRTKIFEIE